MGLVEKIERYRIHDGPGIRTAVFFMGCPMRCAWCSNPETWELKKVLLYMEENCEHCFTCVTACPEKALEAGGDALLIDRAKCTSCGACSEICPTGALSIVGEWLSVDEVAEEIVKDRPFYDSSGGGVTLTGGEPTMQAVFLEELCRRLRDEYISIALDTCGLFDMEKFRSVAPHVEYVLFDIKAVDPSLHQVYTGVGNAKIMSNLRELDHMGKKIILRMIIIPGINDSREELEKKLAMSENLRNVVRVDILPYHTLGQGKYPALGMEYSMPESEDAKPDFLQDIRSRFEDRGIPCTVGGIT